MEKNSDFFFFLLLKIIPFIFLLNDPRTFFQILENSNIDNSHVSEDSRC